MGQYCYVVNPQFVGHIAATNMPILLYIFKSSIDLILMMVTRASYTFHIKDSVLKTLQITL